MSDGRPPEERPGHPWLSGRFCLACRYWSRQRVLAVLLLPMSYTGCHAAIAPPAPVAVLSFESPPTQSGIVDATPAFLGEDVIAVRRCAPFNWRVPSRACWLEVAALSGGDLRITAQAQTAESPAITEEVSAMPNGAILLTSAKIEYLYSPDLKIRREILTPLVVPQPPGNVVGQNKEDPADHRWSWTLYRLTPSLELVPVRRGQGELYRVSDDYLMFFDYGMITVETLDGRLLGLHRVPPDAASYSPEIIGPDRLYLSGKKPAVADFNGRETLELHVPEGYGPMRWSAGGKRLLFDHFIYTPMTPGRLIEDYFALPRPKGANSEVVRVLDTSNGGVCFEWASPGKLLGEEGQAHADLSPSGRLLATVTSAGLAVYQLPENCIVK